MRIYFNCQYCGKERSERKSHYDRKKKHYCSRDCYANDRRDNWKPEEQPTWKGGITPYESHRKYVKKNPERIKHLKARRYARKKNAEGSHTLEQWQALKRIYRFKCGCCGLKKELTKDHMRPLSKGGTDYISNIEPLCKNCNSKKHNKLNIHETPELL